MYWKSSSAGSETSVSVRCQKVTVPVTLLIGNVLGVRLHELGVGGSFAKKLVSHDAKPGPMACPEGAFLEPSRMNAVTVEPTA